MPKQYRPIAGVPMLVRSVRAMLADARLARVFVVVSAQDGRIDAACAGLDPGRVRILRCGGETRDASVRNGLDAMDAEAGAQDWVLVHDAARPGLTPRLLGRLIDACVDDPVGGLLALPVADTLKRADGAGRVESTVAREDLWQAQTPQMFRHGMLKEALSAAAAAAGVTDEAGAIERAGQAPKLVRGEARNFKMTFAEDFELIERLLDD